MTTETAIPKQPNQNIKFRVLFVSPFFELEVKCGMGRWQSVHSQDNVSDNVENVVYPILHFISFQAAMLYAKDVLGINKFSTGGWLGLFSSPPASFMSSNKAVTNKVTTSVVYK